MKLYEPYVYIKWGLIVGIIGFLPFTEIVAVLLFGFGILLELIIRDNQSSKPHD